MNPQTPDQKPWYERFFENTAETYEREGYIQGTVGECDFIEQEIQHDKTREILDIGCGTGRHAVELARRGYRVVGIDLSASMLEKAREKARQAGVAVEFQRHDARELPFEDRFDLAIMLCEGAFPLMETDEMNYEILRRATRALKPKGKFLFTTLNGLFPLFHSVEGFCAAHSDPDKSTCRANTFDLMTFRDHNITTVKDDQGRTLEMECNERYYVPSEITWLLKSLGYRKIDIFGAKLGAFSRQDALATDDFEMLVVAEK